jgi:hypothetical protein
MSTSFHAVDRTVAGVGPKNKKIWRINRMPKSDRKRPIQVVPETLPSRAGSGERVGDPATGTVVMLSLEMR